VFLKLLELKGTDDLFEARSIQMLIELMWENYKPKILKWGFWPYVFNLLVLFVLTSWSNINYLENIKVANEIEEESHHMGTGAPGSMIEGGEPAENLQTIFWITLSLGIIEFMYCIWNAYREFKQIYFIGFVDYLTFWNLFDFTLIVTEATYIFFLADVMLHNHLLKDDELY
jgi:hypothetical protein